MTLAQELESRYDTYLADWTSTVSTLMGDVAKQRAVFLRSYKRIATLQAWRVRLLADTVSPDSIAFFLEAQNDALVSHIQMATGSWRAALKSLRSCIENTLLMCYFKDHPVELRKWESGKFRFSFSENMTYLESHPMMVRKADDVTGMGIIRQEYEKLSKAVHASSREFRMTEDGRAIALWHPDQVYTSKWSTHEGRVIQGLNLILIVLFHDYMQGAAQIELRRSIAFGIPQSKDKRVEKVLGVRIRR